MKAYEVALRMGVRFIELDILDSTTKDGQLVPLACNGTSALEEALETIDEHGVFHAATERDRQTAQLRTTR